ncbi:MAG: hypothetical protein HXS44_11890 [Theionarchaea archaeon]|nr:hypothetical protein [Theionarchaea archaeon]
MKKSKLSGLLFLVLTAAALAAPAWTPVERISLHADNAMEDDFNPQIAVDGNGNSYVVWEGYDGNDYEIYWVKIKAEGTSDVKKVSNHIDNESEDDHTPQIAVDGNGNSYVVWEGYDGNDYEIYWVKITSLGIPGGVEKISTHEDNIRRDDINPQIGVDGNGNSYVVWRGFDSSDFEIYWVKMDTSGIPGNVEKVSLHRDNINLHDQDPQIGVDTRGNSSVVWRGFDGNDQDIYWVRITTTGVINDVQKVSIGDTQDRDDYEPQIAVDGNGNSFVTWEGDDGNDHEIYWAKVEIGASEVEKISNHIDNEYRNDFNPQIAVDVQGNSYVVWRGFDGNDFEIYWVKVSLSGTSGSVEKISNHKDNIIWDDSNPQIAVDSTGISHITWEGFDGIDQDIYWVQIDASDVIGSAEKISTHEDNINGYDRLPQIAVDNKGEVHIVWEGFNGNNEDIYFTSTFTDAGGPRTSNITVTPTLVRSDSTVVLTAMISDSITGGSLIKAAEYFINSPGENGKGIPMSAVDGRFDSSNESVKAVIDVKALSVGIHTVYVHGQDAQGNWGSFRLVQFRIYKFSSI